MGDCVFGGEKTGVSKTHVKNNYISGEITLNNEFVDQSGNKTVTAKTDGEKVVIERSSGLRKTKYSKAIR